jgi:hypothetical protein
MNLLLFVAGLVALVAGAEAAGARRLEAGAVLRASRRWWWA